MFVSILQLMGFPLGKPVHSRASENSGVGGINARIERITGGEVRRTTAKGENAVQAHAQANSARRTVVKAKVGRTAVSAKVQSKPGKSSAAASPVKKAAVKPVGTSVKKPLSRRDTKPTSKATIKPATKTGSKADVKASAKSHAKPAAKPLTPASTKLGAKASHVAASKASAKTPAKTPVKAATSGASKAPLKPAVTIKNQKLAPKVAANKVNPVLKTLSKPVAQPSVKPAATKVAKAAQELKPVAVKLSASQPLKGKPDSKTGVTAGSTAKALSAKPVPKNATALAPQTTPQSAPKALAVAPVVAVTAVTSVPSVPPKAGRPSSRLAQLTVPSMAQSVASTAAKSSFSQSTALPLIVPPLPSATKKDPKLANNWKTKPVEQLTDAELMAMPDSEYMNDKQMAVFRLKLSILKQDILNSASDTTEHLREDTVVVPDPADRATIEEEHALELRTRDRERKLLKKIEQSINSIDAGDYGYCDETGEPIGVGRLLARPTATLSLEAQQRRELKQKMFGD